MGNQLLLLEDVDDLGRSGDVVSVKPGFARNFLLPQKKAVVADKNTLRMQARLKEEREKRAAVDKKDSEILAFQVRTISKNRLSKKIGDISKNEIDLIKEGINLYLNY